MRLLVIEDEPDLLRIVARALREEGYAVDEAANGRDGLFKAIHCDYDLIVLDLMLPQRNGWEVLTELRKAKKTPVIIVTARDAVPERVRGLDYGADDYIVKPYELSELFARVRSLIRRSAGEAKSEIAIGPIRIDMRKRLVAVNGGDIGLTAREYAIVEYLASRRGKVVSRSEIYDHIFDENDDTMSNLLDVHVANIRRKLGKDFIITRRGQGYLIDG